MKRVAIEYPTDGLEKIFTQEKGYFPIIVKPGDKLPDADLVVFSGGADVNPALYGESPIPETSFSSSRDLFSSLLHRFYKDLPKIGVCRGAQYLCVANGGKLWQDVPGHRMNTHYVWDWVTGKKHEVQGDHHQACNPDNTPHTRIATTTAFPWAKNAHGIVDGGWEEDPIVAYEAFYITKDRALCIQWHPEWGHKESHDYFFEVVERYIK